MTGAARAMAPRTDRVRTPSGDALVRPVAAWDEWLTFALAVVAIVAVVISIEQADWVDEMPSLAAAAAGGLAVGWVLAHLHVRQWLLHIVGVLSGVLIASAEVAHVMRLADPAAGGGAAVRAHELLARNITWADALLHGGISSDALPFVLLIVLGTWGIAYVAAWAVLRWHNPWLALLPAGFALLTNISYLPGQPSRVFLVYLVAALMLFSRLHVQRAIDRWGARGEAPAFVSLEVLHVTWWLALVLVVAAWLLPAGGGLGPVAGVWAKVLAPAVGRVEPLGRLFVGVGSKRDRGIHDFPDALPLQGDVVLTDTVLLKVTASEPAYLRLATFDTYSATGWRASHLETTAVPKTDLEVARGGTDESRTQFRKPVSIEVQVVQPVNDRRLPVPGNLLASSTGVRVVTGASGDETAVQPGKRLRTGTQYAVVGAVAGAPIERLAVAGTEYPAWVREQYLQLPDDLPDEVRALAQRVGGATGNPYSAARSVEAFLRRNYRVDLTVPAPPPGRDAVAYFLFDARRGYFDYHATAMAVLLRAVGVPARVAIGYTLDDVDLDANTKQYQVSERRTWAWTEVYFPGYGWVEFNPTPGSAPIQRPGDDEAFKESNPTLVDPTLGADANDETLRLSSGGTGGASSEPVAPAPRAGGGAARAIGVVFALAIALLGIIGGAWLVWARAFRGLPPAAARWAKVQHLAAWAGASPLPTRTPIEAAHALRTALVLRADLEPLARAYTRERYGQHGALGGDDADMEQLYLSARDDLLRVLIRRLWPFAGPRRPVRPLPPLPRAR